MRSLLSKLTTAALLLTSAAATSPKAQEPNNNGKGKRQETADYSELLQIASEAGIPIPTDNPALLLSIAPIAAELNSALPTAPVLSVLETALPSGFLSNVVHDPSFAASFLSEFEAGSSPSWFLALPTSVKEYLHTYNNYASVETAVGGIQSVESVASSVSASSVSASLASAGSGTASITGNTTDSIASSTGTGTGSNSGTSSGTSAAATGSSTGSSSSSSSAGAAAARETGALAAGAVAMAGILGLAVAL